MDHFLILGRPRSRTAWVANLLTVPPVSFCLHEGLADGGASFPRLQSQLSKLDAEVTGNADTGLIHHLDEVLATFPTARLVLLVGNDASWRTWCQRHNLHAKVRAKVESDFEQARERLAGRALFVDCRALTADSGEAKRLWSHCLPGHAFQLQRWEMLKDLNVQVIPESLGRRLRRSGLISQLGRTAP